MNPEDLNSKRSGMDGKEGEMLPPTPRSYECLPVGENNPRGRGPAGAAYPVSLGLEIHLELAAGVPEGLWPPHGICVFLESVVRGN